MQSDSLDKFSIACSGACVAHCALTPALVYLAPAIAKYLGSEWIHIFLLITLTPISLVALFRGWGKHGQKVIVLIGSIGVLTLLSAVLLEEFFSHIHELEVVLTVIGCLTLITAHFLNIKKLQVIEEAA